MSLFRRGFYSLTNGILQTTICMCEFFCDFYLLKYRTITLFCILKYFYAIALLTIRTYVL